MNYKCITTNCPNPRRPGSRHCAACDRLLDGLAREVRREAKGQSEAYVGRTCDPYARSFEQAAKGRTNFRPLYRSDDARRICSLESALIKRTSHLYKQSNRTTKSLG